MFEKMHCPPLSPESIELWGVLPGTGGNRCEAAPPVARENFGPRILVPSGTLHAHCTPSEKAPRSMLSEAT